MNASEAKAVFLSYASQDAEAARRLVEALRAAGVEVWFDLNELVGGDAWDAKIRSQIAACALFVPVISAATQARREGYFRLEWKLAAQRTHMMSARTAFLVPVVIDATRDSAADVPEEFKAVQWTRLPGGEATPAFCARVRKLLGVDTAVAGAQAEARSESSPGEVCSPGVPRQTTARRWLWPGIALGVAVLAGLAWWQPWHAKETAAPAASTVATVAVAAPAAPLTEAQQLVAKARKILDEGDEVNRETYTLAEDLLKKAEALDVTEASAWALHADLSASMIRFGLDNYPSRREALQLQASRAMKLAPDSPDSQLAIAKANSILLRDLAETRQEVKKLAERYPEDWRALRLYGQVLGLTGNTEEALAVHARALLLAPNETRLRADLVNFLRLDNRFAEAERATREALASRPSARLLVFDARSQLIWRGDPAGAAGALKDWPSWLLQEDRGVGMAAQVYLWNREPAKLLEAASRISRPYLRDLVAFEGPRAVLTALAHEQAAHPEAARADWMSALKATEEELVATPESLVALHWQAWAHARLGNTAAAEERLKLMRQRSAGRYSNLYLVGGYAGLELLLGHPEAALTELRPDRPSDLRQRAPLVFPKAFLRLNPFFETLRGDPRFQALVDAAPGPEEKAPAPASTPTAAAAPAPDEKSLVVLPLENLSPDPENAYFTDGMHAEIIATLARFSDLKVISRNSALVFKGSTTSLSEIAQKLGVANIITGSVRRAGQRLRIVLELRRARDEALLWTQTFDKEMSDVFAIQSEMASEVARVLQARGGQGLFGGAQALARDPRAYDLYLKALDMYFKVPPNQNGTPSAYGPIIALMEESLRYTPDYVPAANLLARIHINLATRDTDPVRRLDAARIAKKWAETASRLMPGGAGDALLGRYYGSIEQDHARAIELCENAIRALPNDLDGYNFAASSLARLGRLTEALDYFQRCIDPDPRSAPNWSNVAGIQVSLRRYEAAKATLAQVEALFPNRAQSQQNQLSRYLMAGAFPENPEVTGLQLAYWRFRARRFDEALCLAESLLADSATDPVARFQLLCLKVDVLRRLGREAAAVGIASMGLDLAEKLQAVPELGPSEKPTWKANALLRAGRYDEAINLLGSQVKRAQAGGLIWLREADLAAAYAYAGRARECVALLARLLAVQNSVSFSSARLDTLISVPALRVDPAWDNVRADPGFQALLADPKNSEPL